MPKIPQLIDIPAEWRAEGANMDDIARLNRQLVDIGLTPNHNPRLSALTDAISEALKRTRFSPNTPNTQTARYLGLLGDWAPALSETRSGTKLGDLPLYASRRGRSHYEPYNPSIHLADQLKYGFQGLTPEQNLAATLTHEAVHAVRDIKGRTLQHDAWLPTTPQERADFLRATGGDRVIQEMWAMGDSRIRPFTTVAERRNAGPGMGPTYSYEMQYPDEIPYFRRNFEESARRSEAYGAKHLLSGNPAPFLGLAAVPGLFDALSQWSQTRGDQPVPEFLRGAVNGVSPTGSIPTSAQIANAPSDILSLLASDDPAPRAELMGKITQYLGAAGDMLRNPLFSVYAILKQLRSNPAYGAGNLAAMFLPTGKISPEMQLAAKEGRIADFEHLAQEGGPQGLPRETILRAMEGGNTGAEMGKKGQLWNVVQSDEGRYFWGAPHEHHGDTMMRLEDAGHTFTHPNAQGWAVRGTSPNDTYIGTADLEPHNADFVKAYKAKYPDPWTREERGGQMLDALGVQQHSLPANDPGASLAYEFPNAPTGQTMRRNGEQWVNTTRGWTRNIDAAVPKGPHAPPDLIAQVGRVARDKGAAWAVQEAITHGGMEPKWAGTLVNNILSQWSAGGVKLSPEQNAWLELYRAGKYKP